MRRFLIFFGSIILFSGYGFCGEIPDSFSSDRFIFIGSFRNKPIIASMEFSRGYGERQRVPYKADFNGHFLFMDIWNHMKNGIYYESRIIPGESMDTIPDFNPCLLVWKEMGESGAINYEAQEISFLLQFRNIKPLDTVGREPRFRIHINTGEAIMLFQGENIYGRLVYIKSRLTGYNRLANNVSHLRRRKYQEFFLVGKEGDTFIIWCEQEKDRIRGQWVPHEKFIHCDKEGNLILKSENLKIEWTNSENETKPDSPFREYPTSWKLETYAGGRDQNINLRSLAHFYWFNQGMSGVSGDVEGEKVMGLARIIRGK